MKQASLPGMYSYSGKRSLLVGYGRLRAGSRPTTMSDALLTRPTRRVRKVMSRGQRRRGVLVQYAVNRDVKEHLTLLPLPPASFNRSQSWPLNETPLTPSSHSSV
jgi:hypothetical protein